jgi:hypothetical protein
MGRGELCSPETETCGEGRLSDLIEMKTCEGDAAGEERENAP